MTTISALSTEYIKASVAAVIEGSTVDPTSDTVTVAWMRPGAEPADSDFGSALWETDTTTTPTTYYARRLISAGDLAPGPWVMWIKVIHTPETIIRAATGVLTVT